MMDAPSAVGNVESIKVDFESDTASLPGNAILDQDAFTPVVKPLGSLTGSSHLASNGCVSSYSERCRACLEPVLMVSSLS